MTISGQGLIAIDWGTTNRRIFLLDRDGGLQARESDGAGVSAIPPGAFPAEIERIRARFGDLTLLLAGMIGSTRGWIEAPYVACPLTLPQLVGSLLWPEPGRTAIVPGACLSGAEAADVMRGEEVQLFGAVAAKLVGPDAILCLPGTHAKWARIAAGALTDFRTVMTGELFALLRGHSILSAQMQGDVADGAAFREGVRTSLADRGALTADLFGTRARILLGKLREADAAAYVSGLLIGADLGVGLALAPAGPIGLVGAPALTGLYAAALDEAGRQSREIDGEEAFLSGIKAIAELI